MKRSLRLAAGLVVSGLALWLTLRGRDLHAIWAATLDADLRYVLPYLAFPVAIHFVRTLRWGILLEPVARVPFARLNAAAAVGFMALTILPFRLGELARPCLVAERPTLRVSAALSSVVVERVVDGLFMAALLVLTLLAVPEGARGVQAFRVAGLVVFALFAAILAFLAVAHRNRAAAVRFTERALGSVSPRVAARASGMMDAFIQGLRLVPSRRKMAAFFGLTLLYWGLSGWGMKVLARGFGFDLPLVAAYTVLGVLVVGVMIPAGPGMVGTYQAAVVLGLSLFAPRERVDVQGTAYANVLWAIQLVFVTAFGLVFLFSRHIRLARLLEAPADVERQLEEEEAEHRAEEERVEAGARSRRSP